MGPAKTSFLQKRWLKTRGYYMPVIQIGSIDSKPVLDDRIDHWRDLADSKEIRKAKLDAERDHQKRLTMKQKDAQRRK
jgi:hypothetical protein